MNFHKIFLLGLILLFLLGNSAPASKVEGEIFITTSIGEKLPFNETSVLLLKKSDAKRLRDVRLTRNLSLLKKHLATVKPVTVTDANGKFSLSVSSGDYVIAVLADRMIDGEQQVFFWLYEFNDKTGGHISLNNNNLTEDFVAEEIAKL